jgi:PPOX class probable F420-dependent enzyme
MITSLQLRCSGCHGLFAELSSNFQGRRNGGDTMADAPIRLDETTRAAIASGRLVHLATINADGTPQVTCIYVGWDGDEIVAGHLADHVKLRNIRRDPRVTLSVESDIKAEGFSPYVVIQGIARVEEGGAAPLLRRITDGQFPPPGNWPEGFVTRISPRKLSGTGPWSLAN